jgi:hypothetical protein
MNDLFAKIFELEFLFGKKTIDTDLYEQSVYGTVGLIMVIISLLVPFIFYFAMDKTRYAGFLYWFLGLVSVFLVIFGITFFLARHSLTTLGAEYAVTQYLAFSAIVALYGVVIYFIMSIILKRFTTSLARSPF